MKAFYPDVCPRCPAPIVAGQDVVLRKGVWIHAACATGGDDE